jgi:hypothetical protein
VEAIGAEFVPASPVNDRGDIVGAVFDACVDN